MCEFPIYETLGDETAHTSDQNRTAETEENIAVHERQICVLESDSANEQNALVEYVSLGTANTSEGDKTAEIQENIGDSHDISGCLLGLTRKTIGEMYELYCNHARALGFSVRKSTTRMSNNKKNVVLEKYYVCSCAGLKKKMDNHSENSSEDDSVSSKKMKRVCVTRTRCQASLRVKLNNDGVYEVVHHVLLHNHPFTRKEWSHLHRFERKITNEKGKAIEDMISSGMRPTDSYRYMAYNAGGDNNVGHTIKDHLNFVNRLKVKAIEGGDAQTVIDMLYQQAVEEEDFYFRVKLDDTGRLCNVFWRDSMMKEDYKIYCDVVVFDTTYRTNRYNLICAPFVGINNHWRNVMFGCAFLSDEKTTSFEWLFEVFRKSMGAKCPVTLFTDQDQAIANAIEKVFPETRHRLCLWHLHQNAISRFGEFKRDKSFKDAFNKCLTGCADQNEFESCWKSMISKYELQDHAWFTRLYTLKEKWATALSKDFFSAGLRSSQRSESTNNAIGFNAKKTTSLIEFYSIFKETIKRWRAKEQHDEFQCSRSNPTSILPLTGLLKHAAEVYTLAHFKDFEAEFVKSISTYSTVVLVEESMMVYDISCDGGACYHHVTFDCLNNFITCTCKKLEECGLLCYHCLRVLHMHSVSKIPEIYILKRWTKFAKSELWDNLSRQIGLPDKPRDSILWRHAMLRKYYNLVLKCEGNEEAKRIIEDGYNRDFVAVDALLTSLNSVEQCDPSVGSGSSNSILDPIRSVTKGRRQTMKGHFQKSKKKKTIDASNSNQDKEFGSKTPNLRLF